MSILKALSEISEERAIHYVQAYYGALDPSHESYGAPFHGAYFDTLDQEVLKDTSNLITGSDLYAMTLLQARVKRTTGAALLFHKSEQISGLLNKIPDSPLEDLSEKDFSKLLGHGSAAQDLWKVLRSISGVGPTIASKIMARKRPNLVPIYDSFIKKVTQVPVENSWQSWWEAFKHDEGELRGRADVLLNNLNRSDLSRLRVLDVMFWYSRKFGVHSAYRE